MVAVVAGLMLVRRSSYDIDVGLQSQPLHSLLHLAAAQSQIAMILAAPHARRRRKYLFL